MFNQSPIDGHWACCQFSNWQIMLQWTCTCKSFSRIYKWNPRLQECTCANRHRVPIALLSGIIDSHYYQQWWKLPFPTSSPHFTWSGLLILVNLMEMKWYLFGVLLCILLITSEIEIFPPFIHWPFCFLPKIGYYFYPIFFCVLIYYVIQIPNYL